MSAAKASGCWRQNDLSALISSRMLIAVNPTRTAELRAFSWNFSITQCDAVYRRSLIVAPDSMHAIGSGVRFAARQA
jgi:hypothetical protein